MHTSPLPSVALGMGSRGLQENAIVSYLEHNFVKSLFMVGSILFIHTSIQDYLSDFILEINPLHLSITIPSSLEELGLWRFLFPPIPGK